MPALFRIYRQLKDSFMTETERMNKCRSSSYAIDNSSSIYTSSNSFYSLRRIHKETRNYWAAFQSKR
jgi:hypothetical protein